MDEMRVHRPSHLDKGAYAEIPSNQCVPDSTKFLEMTTLFNCCSTLSRVNFLIRMNKITCYSARQSHMKNHARTFPHKLSK